MEYEPPPEGQRQWHYESLKWCLQALAARPEEQLALFPSFVCKSEELALDFDHWRFVVLRNYPDDLSAEQLGALAIIDARLSAISSTGPEFSEEIWTDGAITADPHWAELRVLAHAALEAFGWPREPPTTDSEGRGGYVPG